MPLVAATTTAAQTPSATSFTIIVLVESCVSLFRLSFVVIAFASCVCGQFVALLQNDVIFNFLFLFLANIQRTIIFVVYIFVWLCGGDCLLCEDNISLVSSFVWFNQLLTIFLVALIQYLFRQYSCRFGVYCWRMNSLCFDICRTTIKQTKEPMPVMYMVFV